MDETILQIPVPCHQKWSCMTKAKNGKLCSVCNKIVVDFRSMSKNEAEQYLLKHKSQNICGHLKANQIQNKYNKIQRTLIDIYNHIEQTSKFKFLRLSCLFFLSFIIMFAGCHNTVGTIVTGDTALNSNLIDSSKADSLIKSLNDTVNIDRKRIQ